MDVAGLRAQLSLTQAQMAALMGLTQAAVSQYESGRREPGGVAAAFYRRLQAAVDAPVVTESVGHRVTTMPQGRWERVIDPDRVDVVELPVRLDWSPREAGHWSYNDEVHRRELYRLLIDVGQAVDVMTYVDINELTAWADELLVSRDARGVLERIIERTKVPSGV